MRQLQLTAYAEPSDVIELRTVSEPVLGQEDVLGLMEAAPLNPSDFLLVRGMYPNRKEGSPIYCDAQCASDLNYNVDRRHSGALFRRALLST